MEEKQNLDLESIEEKLCELKNTVESPDCSALFAGFAWTREWFKSAEDTLLDFASREESDSIVIEFIRAKIRETDVRRFNDVLRGFSAKSIKNHYDLIINTRNHSKCESIHNDNDAIIDYVIPPRYCANIDPGWSINKNDKMVEYLINNTNLIVWPWFSSNPSDRAVDYLLNHVDRIDFEFFSNNTNTRAVQYMIDHPDQIRASFSANNHDLAVTYLLSHRSKIDISIFSTNTNQRAVKHLLRNPHHINWQDFNENNSDAAVDYLLANPDKIIKDNINLNENVKITKYLIDNPRMIYSHCFIRRTDDLAVNYIIGGKLEQPYDPDNLSSNTSDIMLEHLMNNPKLICRKRLELNNCNYTRQKFREFNKLGLFPRLIGLVI